MKSRIKKKKTKMLVTTPTLWSNIYSIVAITTITTQIKNMIGRVGKYNSVPSSAKQQRDITTFAVWRQLEGTKEICYYNSLYLIQRTAHSSPITAYFKFAK